MDANEKIIHWAEEGARLSPPDWDQLPTIPLYVDQVLLYLRDSLHFFERDEDDLLLTNSMINNYVKTGVLAHPEKKKYSRQHLAALITICMLKQVLALQDIVTLLDGEDLGPELYELLPIPARCGKPAKSWPSAARLEKAPGGRPCAWRRRPTQNGPRQSVFCVSWPRRSSRKRNSPKKMPEPPTNG